MSSKMKYYLMNHDRRMNRDGRNPYGSRGGYVTSRRDHGRGYNEGEFRGMNDQNYRSDRNYDEPRYRDHRDMNYENDYRQNGMDYHNYPMNDYGGGYLNRDELHAWKRMLCDELEKGECEMFSDDKILKRAKENGIRFENFTEDEFIVAVLMMYTDYGKTLGKANIDTYVKMANDFLCDEDAGVKYGEKLTAYFDHVVNV